MFWGLVKLGFKAVFGIFGLMFCALCSISVLSATAVNSLQGSKPADIETIALMLFRDDQEQVRETQGYHGFYAGYYGFDYTTECGDTLYSPLPGRGVVTYKGLDGTKWDNSMLRIEGEAGEIVLLHGDYNQTRVGAIVIGGVTPIGKNASIGNSGGCHAHIVWNPDENFNGVIAHRRIDIVHTGNKGKYGSVLSQYNTTKLRISHYNPYEGGINCDGDCSTMASGEKTAAWILGQNGIYAAACPQEWPMGTLFTVDNQTYTCKDRGGWINCYAPGDFDPAMSNAYKSSYIAEEPYCWVDLMADSGHPYGYLTSRWAFGD